MPALCFRLQIATCGNCTPVTRHDVRTASDDVGGVGFGHCSTIETYQRILGGSNGFGV